jgi:hypothetical protein
VKKPARRAGDQLDLLAWSPPQPVVAFEPATIRAQDLRGRVARAVSVALGDAGVPREDIAREMGAWLGRPISKAMLDACASVAREDHTISLPWLMALLHATGDRRLLEMLAEPLGWAVIERRYLPLIELAAVQEQGDVLRRKAKVLRRQARGRGAL